MSDETRRKANLHVSLACIDAITDHVHSEHPGLTEAGVRRWAREEAQKAKMRMNELMMSHMKNDHGGALMGGPATSPQPTPANETAHSVRMAECASGDHRWLSTGWCSFCSARKPTPAKCAECGGIGRHSYQLGPYPSRPEWEPCPKCSKVTPPSAPKCVQHVSVLDNVGLPHHCRNCGVAIFGPDIDSGRARMPDPPSAKTSEPASVPSKWGIWCEPHDGSRPAWTRGSNSDDIYPTPGEAEKCAERFRVHRHAAATYTVKPYPDPPSEKGPPEMPHERITLFTLNGDDWDWCMPGYAHAVPLQAAHGYTRDDLAAEQVAKSVNEKGPLDQLRGLLDFLGAKPGEPALTAIRRVVAERDAAVANVAAKVAEAIDADRYLCRRHYIEACEILQCGAGEGASDAARRVVASVAELEAELATEKAAVSDRDKIIEAAEKRVKELTDDYRKACDELRRLQTKSADEYTGVTLNLRQAEARAEAADTRVKELENSLNASIGAHTGDIARAEAELERALEVSHARLDIIGKRDSELAEVKARLARIAEYIKGAAYEMKP